MSDFDDKLNSILNDPGSMAQIMQLAQSLSGGSQSPSSGTSATFAPPTAPPPPNPAPAQPTGSFFPDGFDAQTIQRFLPLLKEMQSQESSNASQLLLALRPYLREEKQEKVGRAIQIAKLIRMGKHFFSGLEG